MRESLRKRANLSGPVEPVRKLRPFSPGPTLSESSGRTYRSRRPCTCEFRTSGRQSVRNPAFDMDKKFGLQRTHFIGHCGKVHGYRDQSTPSTPPTGRTSLHNTQADVLPRSSAVGAHPPGPLHTNHLNPRGGAVVPIRLEIIQSNSPLRGVLDQPPNGVQRIKLAADWKHQATIRKAIDDSARWLDIFQRRGGILMALHEHATPLS